MLLKPRNGPPLQTMSLRKIALTQSPAFHAEMTLPSIARRGSQSEVNTLFAEAPPWVGAMLTVAGAGVTWQAAALTLLSSLVSTTLWSLSAHTWIGASRKGRLPDNGTETCTVALTASA